MAVEPSLALDAIARLTEYDWRVMKNQVWFPYNYNKGNIMILLAEPLLLRRSASGTKVREDGRPEVKSRYREESAPRRNFLDFARLVWRRYLLPCTDLTAIPTLEKQDALTPQASPITSAAMADVEVPVDRSPLGSAAPDDEDDWTMGDLVVVDAEERVGVKCRPRDLQKSCRVKGQKVS